MPSGRAKQKAGGQESSDVIPHPRRFAVHAVCQAASEAKYNLATSGIMSYPLAELPVKLEDLEISGPTLYGYAPLKERLAKRNGVTPDCVVTAAGTSMANHLALAATLEPGEEALVEHPTYELLVTTLQYLGATVRYFERRMEHGFRVDPEEVERKMTPQTRLIVLTNLHNPSGAYIDEATLRAVGETGEEARRPRAGGRGISGGDVRAAAAPAIHLGEHFVVTSSLTKAFGLSGLRCGWVLANPELTQRMWHINDLYGVNAAFPADLLSVIALDNLDRVAAASEEAAAVRIGPRWMRSCDRATTWNIFLPEFGTVAFPKLKSGSVDNAGSVVAREV